MIAPVAIARTKLFFLRLEWFSGNRGVATVAIATIAPVATVAKPTIVPVAD